MDSYTCVQRGSNKPVYAKFEAVPGFSEQTEKDGVKLKPSELADASFGLIDQPPECWTNFKKKIEELQADAPEGVSYKVYYCGRHGQGWHNVATDLYGDDWKTEWAKRMGNDVITWGPDAELTPKGREEALVGTKQNALAVYRLTGVITDYPKGSEKEPRDDRETPEHAQNRLRGLLGYSFDTMPETYISITSHSSTPRALLDVLDHTHKKFETAEVIPLVVKVTVHSKGQVEKEQEEKKGDKERK